MTDGILLNDKDALTQERNLATIYTYWLMAAADSLNTTGQVQHPMEYSQTDGRIDNAPHPSTHHAPSSSPSVLGLNSIKPATLCVPNSDAFGALMAMLLGAQSATSNNAGILPTNNIPEINTIKNEHEVQTMPTSQTNLIASLTRSSTDLTHPFNLMLTTSNDGNHNNVVSNSNLTDLVPPPPPPPPNKSTNLLNLLGRRLSSGDSPNPAVVPSAKPKRPASTGICHMYCIVGHNC